MLDKPTGWDSISPSVNKAIARERDITLQAIRTAFTLLELGYQEGYLGGEKELGDVSEEAQEAKVALSQRVDDIIFAAGGNDLLQGVKKTIEVTTDDVLRRIVEIEDLTLEEILLLAIAAKDEMQEGVQKNRMGHDLDYAKRDMAMELLLLCPDPSTFLDRILKEEYLMKIFGVQNSNLERLKMLSEKFPGLRAWLSKNKQIELLAIL